MTVTLERETNPSNPGLRRRLRNSEIEVSAVDVNTGELLEKEDLRRYEVMAGLRSLYAETFKLSKEEVDLLFSESTLDRRMRTLRTLAPHDFRLPKNSVVFERFDFWCLLEFEKLIIKKHRSLKAAERHIEKYGLPTAEYHAQHKNKFG